MRWFTRELVPFGTAFSVWYYILLLFFVADLLILIIAATVLGAIIPALIGALLLAGSIVLMSKGAIKALFRVMMFQFLLFFILVPMLESFLVGFHTITYVVVAVMAVFYGWVSAFICSRLAKDDANQKLKDAVWLTNMLAIFSGLAIVVSQILENLSHLESPLPGIILPEYSNPLLTFLIAFILFNIPHIVSFIRTKDRHLISLLSLLQAIGIVLLFMAISLIAFV